MRLREIHKIMIDNIEPLKKAKTFSKNNDGYVYVENFTSITKSISNIETTHLIKNEINELEENNLIMFTGPTKVKFTPDRYTAFTNIINAILNKIDAIDSLVDDSYEAHEEDPNSLIVSLPNQSINILEFRDITNGLHQTFKLLNDFEPFNVDEIEVQDFDIGSNWIIILLGTSLAVQVFGQIVFTIQRVQLNGLTTKSLEKQLENIELDEEEKQKFRTTAREIALKTYRSYSNSILEDNDLEINEERLTQMSKVLAQVANLNEQGVGFVSGINSSIDVANSFPKLEQQKPLDMLKQLGETKRISNAD